MREWTPTLGAIFDRGHTTFRVWAPDHDRVDLVVEDVLQGGGIRPLTPESGGYWSATFDDIRPGTLYRYRLDGDEARTFPDPASRYQPHGVHGPSQVVDPRAFPWTDTAWTPPPLSGQVFYELHVGTFTPEGTFRGVIDRLPHLVSLGITTIELMPIGDFAGDRNWGYDGVAIFAPSRAYGTPDDVRALVDAAHRHGLGVFLDVVYNHLGPDGAYANAFSSRYFTDAHCSPWGRGVNLDGEGSSEVRRFFIENALHWVRDYHVDGLRLDATHALVDEGPRHFLEELTTTVRERAGRPVLFVAEDHRNLATLVQPATAGGLGLDGVWADDFHHQARVHTAHDNEGYYADFSGSTEDVATTLRQGWFFTGQYSEHLSEARGTQPVGVAPHQFVICIQNHDQVGNRADGARLHHEIDLPAYRALSTLLLLSPETPLLFMGQEWAASTPFQFFTSFDPELGRKVTEGRRSEFSSFAAFADPAQRDSIPDPQDPATFARSRLVWDECEREPHRGILQLYRRLLALRRTFAIGTARRGEYTVTPIDGHTIQLTVHDLTVLIRLEGNGPVRPVETRRSLPVEERSGNVPGYLLTTEDPDVTLDPQPVVVEGGYVHFLRPGAVVLSTTFAAPPWVTANRQ